MHVLFGYANRGAKSVRLTPAQAWLIRGLLDSCDEFTGVDRTLRNRILKTLDKEFGLVGIASRGDGR